MDDPGCLFPWVSRVEVLELNGDTWRPTYTDGDVPRQSNDELASASLSRGDSQQPYVGVPWVGRCSLIHGMVDARLVGSGVGQWLD